MDDPAALVALIESGVGFCRAAVEDGRGVTVGLFLTGLAGGVSHCAGMCGPFVLAQVTSRLEAVPATRMREVDRLLGAALLPYHLGRLTTYVGLGVLMTLAAGSAGQAGSAGGVQVVSGVLLLCASLLFAVNALPRLRGIGFGAGLGRWGDLVSRIARPLLVAPTGGRAYLLGVVLGFIPCGLVYAAVTAAASTGATGTAALAMLAFAAGTIPGLVAVGVVGHLAGQRWRALLARAAPGLLLANAIMLAILAGTRLLG